MATQSTARIRAGRIIFAMATSFVLWIGATTLGARADITSPVASDRLTFGQNVTFSGHFRAKSIVDGCATLARDGLFPLFLTCGSTIFARVRNVSCGDTFDSDVTCSYSETLPVLCAGEQVIKAEWHITGQCEASGVDTLTLDTPIMLPDRTPPLLTLVQAVKTPTGDSTPPFKFRSNEDGTLGLTGPCGTSSSAAIGADANTSLALTQPDNATPLAPGTYSTCQVTVTDAAGNTSRPLVIPLFKVVSIADLAPPTVEISAPEHVRGPFSATFVFSEPVTGFNRGDITIGNGKASNFTGSGSRYSATITPHRTVIEAETEITIDVSADVAADSAGVGNRKAARLIVRYVDENYVRSRTQSLIGNFMRRRADQIAANDPALHNRLRSQEGNAADAVQPFALQGNGTAEGGQAAFATSLRQIALAQTKAKSDNQAELAGMMSLGQASLSAAKGARAQNEFDLWMQGKWVYIDGDDNPSDLGLLYVGADYRFSQNFLAGFLTQFDWSSEDNAVQKIAAEGYGWLAGPYIATRLNDNLIFDGRIAWGQSENEVSPFRTYTDQFDGKRWLIKGGLTGEFDFASLTIAPQLGLMYFKESQKSYTDFSNVFMPKQTVKLGRMTFGPTVSSRLLTWDGSSLLPHLSLIAIWDFESAGSRDLSTGIPTASNEGLRGRLEGGLTAAIEGGITLQGNGFFDGIGSSNFRAYGAGAKLVIPIQAP